MLRKLKAWQDILKVYNSKRLRPGKGKMRNRRTIMKRGPCIIYGNDNGITRAFRNIPGMFILLRKYKFKLLYYRSHSHER